MATNQVLHALTPRQLRYIRRSIRHRLRLQTSAKGPECSKPCSSATSAVAALRVQVRVHEGIVHLVRSLPSGAASLSRPSRILCLWLSLPVWRKFLRWFGFRTDELLARLTITQSCNIVGPFYTGLPHAASSGPPEDYKSLCNKLVDIGRRPPAMKPRGFLFIPEAI
jgi:hypothetical protein